MNLTEKRDRAALGFVWRFFERCGAQGVSFAVAVVLARLLNPKDFGTVAMLSVVTSLMGVFVDSGFGNALIQKKDADELDFSSVFYFNMFSCTVLYMLLTLSAPFIAKSMGDAECSTMIRVLGLTLLSSGVKNVQMAYVSRNMIFRKFFFATIGGTLGSAVLGIVFALLGAGAWSLVVQYMSNTILDTVILWITVKWRPRHEFSFLRLYGLFRFGWKILVVGVLESVYSNIRQVLIGKKYTSEDLAFYNRGRSFPMFIVTNVNSSIDSVLLPSMSSEQDDVKRVAAMTRRSVMVSEYVMIPLMIGLMVTANEVVRILLTDKWLPSVFFLRIFCVAFMFYPIYTANQSAMNALGRGDVFLKVEIRKKLVGIAILASTAIFGVKIIAYGFLIESILWQAIASWPNKRLIGYGYFDQLRDMVSCTLLSILMGFVVMCVGIMCHMLNLSDVMVLSVKLGIGIMLYICMSHILRIDQYEYIVTMVKDFIDKKRN